MAIKSTLPVLAALASLGSAHTIMQIVTVDGEAYPEGHGIYMPSDNHFQDDVTSNSMACNGAPVTGFTSSSEVISVKAGSTVTGTWLHDLGATGPDEYSDNKVIDSSHKGPVLAYMKKVDDATQNPENAAGDGWFKVAEAGLISSNEWAMDALISADGVQSVTIPSCIEDGDYLLRFELIALHEASTEGKAQYYMECAQLSVSGGGSTSPETYSIPGIYSASDPGLTFNVYNDNGEPYPSDYPIPGPELFSCGASSSSSGSQSGESSGESEPVASGNSETVPSMPVSENNSTDESSSSAPSTGDNAECEVEYVYAWSTYFAAYSLSSCYYTMALLYSEFRATARTDAQRVHDQSLVEIKSD
ncbi:hypothetical protein Q7P37_003010 [Cladosporium fusiforme]